LPHEFYFRSETLAGPVTLLKRVVVTIVVGDGDSWLPHKLMLRFSIDLVNYFGYSLFNFGV